MKPSLYNEEELILDDTSQYSTLIDTEAEKVDSLQDSQKSSSSKEREQKMDVINTFYMMKLTAISSIGNFLFGYDTGTVSGAVLYFKNTWPEITNLQTECVISVAILGAFFSCLLAGPICDKYGRKPVIIVADVLFIIGSILLTVTLSIEVLILGRFLVGIGIGITSIVIPVYLSEIAPNEIRGSMVGFNAAMIPLGQLTSSCVTLHLRGNWRLMFAVLAVPSFVQLLGMMTMPESQRWLAKKERHGECLKVLT